MKPSRLDDIRKIVPDADDYELPEIEAVRDGKSYRYIDVTAFGDTEEQFMEVEIDDAGLPDDWDSAVDSISKPKKIEGVNNEYRNWGVPN